MRKLRLLSCLVLFGFVLFALTGCVSNTPPKASFSANPTSGTAPLGVNFAASASIDPDGTIVSYSWDFDDGTSENGKETSHVFTAGTYQVQLTVKDNGGKTDTDSTKISVSSSTGEKRLEVMDYQLDQDEDGDVLIPGTAKNISNQTLAAAVVTAKLFNADDERIGTAMDAITFLGPKETWSFEADSLVNYDQVDDVEMTTESSVYESP